MVDRRRSPAGLHLDRDGFKAAIEYTEKTSGFFGRLIEKDYYCSLVLDHLFGHNDAKTFIFKGGTSLNKVYFGFYRLSEDLDFAISVPSDATRGDRRKAGAPFATRFRDLPKAYPELRVSKPWTGANNSTQYLAEIEYTSVMRGDTGTIQIEVGLREPLILKSERRDAQSLLIDAFSGKPVLEAVQVQVMSQAEALAEKARATLARLTPAIRDVYDLWHACQLGMLPLREKSFAELVRRKLAVPGNAPASVSSERRDKFRLQLVTDLRPVLRPIDFDSFNFDEAWQIVEELARASSAD